MRVLWILLVLAMSALPAMAARRVTVEQLDRLLAQTDAKSDTDVARQLSELELTERLSRARLSQLSEGLPGEKSRQALLMIADESAFLDPPASEIPATATPTMAAQKRMMAMTVDYLGKSLPLLPNLFATRETTHFESKPGESEGSLAADTELRPVGRSSATVLYHDNQEFVDTGAEKGGKSRGPEKGLTTWGEFGPILGTVVIDAARSQLSWSHWELGPTGPEAVFRYAVPKEKSHYDVRFCCIGEAYGMEVSEVRQRAGYHGEITVDPENGDILRLTVVADLVSGNPISLASIAVDYAPMEIGSRAYICPARGVALARAPDAKSLEVILRTSSRTNGLPPLQKASAPVREPEFSGSRQTFLNDIAFRRYHLFRAETRVVPEKELAAGATGVSATWAPTETAPAAESIRPAEEVAAENAAAVAKADNAVLAAQPAEPPASGTVIASEALGPEISIADASGLPSAPALPKTATTGNGYTLRINTRLVDVAVVALDKKGRPITNLKAEDLEVYDNGVKQSIRSFTPANSTPANDQAQTARGAGEAVLTNRPTVVKPGSAQPGTVVLMMDGANLAFVDLANAREQAVRFLKGLPAGQRVALYAMRKGGFEVVMEATTALDTAASRLAKWMPKAADLSEAGFNEQRNRQQIETVLNPEDLLSVNGNMTLDSTLQTEPLDAQLRPLGSDPPKSVLGILVDVARHLAPLPGHKSLVWLTSDNALADWNMSSSSIEKGSRFIEPAALRVQEAMNNAHVSIYPLDASHLEANVITADVQRRNVELTPTFQLPPLQEQQREGPEMTAGQDINIYDMGRDMRPNRLSAQMQQDMHSIQGVFREVAAATGGVALPRSNNVVGQLNGVENDGRATYEVGFSPSEPADGKYHLITVKMAGRKDVLLRYRTGFQYDQDPMTTKALFSKAVWGATEMTDIGLTATPATADGSTLKLEIAATDLAMAQEGEFWTDKVDVFLVRRDDAGLRAKVTGQTIGLRLKPETYQKLLREGIPFDQVIENRSGSNTVRILVLDENSGRMGSLTIPAPVLEAKR